MINYLTNWLGSVFLRRRARHFCSFCRYLNNVFLLSPLHEQKLRILPLVHLVYVIAEGNTPDGKPHNTRAICVTPPQSILLIEERLHYMHGNFLGATDRSIPRILQPEQRLRKGRQNITPPSIDQLEKRTSSRATGVA